MNIIKKGNPKEKEQKHKCYKCKTVFSYTRADVQPDPRDGNYVICPGCGAFIASKL